MEECELLWCKLNGADSHGCRLAPGTDGLGSLVGAGNKIERSRQSSVILQLSVGGLLGPALSAK